MSEADFVNPDDRVVAGVLAQTLRVAVVGCSPDPRRDSHRIARLLLEKGHQVIPIHPTADVVLGRRCYPSLAQAPLPIDMVDIFRRSSEVGPVVDQAIGVGARIVWMQLGVIDAAAALRAQAAGMIVIMDRCPAIEYARLFQ